MGQKVNPSLFNKQILIPGKWSLISDKEYPLLFKNQYEIETHIRTLFEGNKFLVKDCFFLSGSSHHKPTLFLSFFPLSSSKSFVSFNLNKNSLNKRLISFFSFLSIRTDFRFIFVNLSKVSRVYLKRKKNSINTFSLRFFRNDPFYESGLTLATLLFVQKDLSPILASYVSFYFKLLLKTRKLSRFLNFVNSIITLVVLSKGTSVKGIKIQIKGRLNGAPRTKTRVIEAGNLSTQSVSCLSSYHYIPIHTSLGSFSLKTWISYF